MFLEISLGPLAPALPEFIAGILLFLAVWYGVAKLVVPKFEQTYAERAEEIAGGIEKAERAQAEAAAALEKYNAQLALARDEASSIREDAKAQGAQILAEMRQHAQDESARLQAVQQLHSQVGGLATQLAGKIVGESLDDDERARRTVDRFIADLEAHSPEKV
mgnify:CR=1 FL=1